MASFNRQNLHATKKKISISYVIREREERYHRAGVNSLQYDPRLDRLYSAGRDSIIRIWAFSENESQRVPANIDDTRDNSNAYIQNGDLKGQDPYIQSMEHHTDWVNDIALCCDGRNLISVSNDTTIKVWNAHQGFCLSTLRSHKDYAKCLAYAKDREIVASAGFDQMIYLWDIQSLTMLTAAKNTVTTKPLDGSKNSIYSLTITQDGTLVASGSTEKVIRLWDQRTRQKLLKLRGHTDNVKSLLFSRDGSMLLSASSDGTVRLWSISQQRCVSIVRLHEGGVWTLQADETFNTVYSGGKDCKVFMTDLKNTAHSSLICREDAPILRLLLTDRNHSLVDRGAGGRGVADKHQSLWVSTTNSTIKNWPILDDITTTGSELDSDLRDKHDPLEVPINNKPDLLIRGNPAVINYHILNDKRHIITLESDNSVALYDVLTARKIECLHPPNDEQVVAKQKYEDEVKKRFRMVYVPNWFTVDLKIGLLCINLEESECLASWVSARDYGFIPHVDGQDPKINLGCLMLQALFEYWPPTYENYKDDLKDHQNQQDSYSDEETNTDEQYHNFNCSMRANNMHQTSKYVPDVRVQSNSFSRRVGNLYFSIPSHTPIIISEGNQTILRFLAQEACNENEDIILREIVPNWISEIVLDISRCQPKFTKIPFFLLPNVNSGIKSLRKERLSASDMLQIRKVVEHVCEKMLINLIEENGLPLLSPQDQSAINLVNTNGSNSDQMPRTYPIDRVELYCNDQKLDEHLDLRTVRHYIWKSGGDLVLHYKPIYENNKRGSNK